MNAVKSNISYIERIRNEIIMNAITDEKIIEFEIHYYLQEHVLRQYENNLKFVYLCDVI